MNAQEQNKKQSLLSRLADASTAFAAPVVATAIASGAVYYGATPSNWTEMNPMPIFGLVFGVPGLICSLMWVRSTYSERSYRKRKKEQEIQEQLESDRKAQEREAKIAADAKAEAEVKARPKFIYQFETKAMPADIAESKMANVSTVLNLYSDRIYKSNFRTYSKEKKSAPSEKYISGVIAVLEEVNAREIAGTIESILLMEKKSLSYKGRCLDNASRLNI